MTPEQLTQSLRQEAARLGFDFSGTCAAVTPTGFSKFLQWLESGFAGQMHYLESRRDAYRHPEHVLPDVKSVLMLAMNYRTADRQEAMPGTGKIARYAWGDVDYHDLIHQRLKQLKQFAKTLIPEMQVRGIVDTAPLLEREFAQLAGLGWVGKNTLLLNKHHGSFFFLAALLVDQTLDYDQPHEANHCGTCTACLDACPTDAFAQPYVLDATQCISYLTIEHRTEIAPALREKMDGWILGCDICQDVCPWNRKAPVSKQPEFGPLTDQNPLHLRGLFALDDEQFRARFRKSPLWRPKRQGILRNAAIALAALPDRQNLPALHVGLHDQESLVRGASAWSLGEHRLEPAEDCILIWLRERLAIEGDPDVKIELQQAINAQMTDP